MGFNYFKAGIFFKLELGLFNNNFLNFESYCNVQKRLMKLAETNILKNCLYSFYYFYFLVAPESDLE